MEYPRFLCDEMLGRLCHYLRAAGYDALLAERGLRDALLLQQSCREGRQFLTQDARIVEHRKAQGVVFIMPHAPLDQLARLVGKQFRLDWLAHAFTRCLVDNSLLVPANEEACAKVPDDVRSPGEPLLMCPTCGRVYWRGSHYRRMRARLCAWQEDLMIS